MLPQIPQQKEHQNSLGSNSSVLEANRPTPIQANLKKMNGADQ